MTIGYEIWSKLDLHIEIEERLFQIELWSFYNNETKKRAVSRMRAGCKILIYNGLSSCTTLVLECFSFFREFSDLIVPTHIIWDIPHIMHPYILIHVSVVLPRIRIQVVCCCEMLFKALSRASPALINQEDPIFSISHQNKAASARCYYHMLSRSPFVSSCPSLFNYTFDGQAWRANLNDCDVGYLRGSLLIRGPFSATIFSN